MIGKALGRAASTISRELRGNLHVAGQYRPFHAQLLSALRRGRPKQPRLATTNAELRGFVADRLAERWSPQQISRALRAAHPDEPGMRLATESIYLALYRPANDLVSRTWPLRTGRDHRRAPARHIRAGRRFAQPMLSTPQGPPVTGTIPCAEQAAIAIAANRVECETSWVIGSVSDEPRPRTLSGYTQALARGMIRLPPQSPPGLLPGPTSEQRFYLYLLATVLSGAALFAVIAWLAGMTTGWFRLVLPAIAIAWFLLVIAGLNWVGTKLYDELAQGYATLTVDFGGFFLANQRVWQRVRRRAPWDFGGLWALDSRGAVSRVPDRSLDAPGFYPSPTRPQALELWSGRVWMGEFRGL